MRSRSHQIVCLVWAACALGMVIGFLVVGFTSSKDPLQQIVAAVVFIALAGAALRWAFTSVVLDYTAGTMIVRNPILTHAVALADVYQIENLDSRMPTRGEQRSLVKLRRTDGSTLTLVGVCAWGDTSVRRVTRELDSAITEMRRQLKVPSRHAAGPGFSRA